MTKGGDLLLLGLFVAGAYWVSTGGMFNTSLKSYAFEGNPDSFNLSNIQSANWTAAWMDSTPASEGPYSGRVMPTLGGTTHW